MTVRERFQHLPMKVARCAIEPVVDQFRDFGAPGKGTVIGVMIDPVLGKEARKAPTVATAATGARILFAEETMIFPVTENIAKSQRHISFYLACGMPEATPIIFLHGWPELSVSWRHQLSTFGNLGFRALAPDMRGYGRSSIYTRHQDYALEQVVADMIELLDAIGAERAIWVGHDWGSPVVWSIAQHHAERCHGVVSLCVPYIPEF